MPEFTKFQPVAVADTLGAAVESAIYLGPSREDNYPYSVLLECDGSFEVEYFKLCCPIDEEGQPILAEMERERLLEQLLEQRLHYRDQEKCLIIAVKREQSNLSSVLDTLSGIEKKLKELDSNQ